MKEWTEECMKEQREQQGTKLTDCQDVSPNKSNSTLRRTMGTNWTGAGKKEEGQEYEGGTLKV